jgi:protein-S-isoprenylcysteine O-methyltransferase Ste14
MDKDNNEGLSNADRVKIHLHYLDHFFRVEQNEELQSEKIIKFFIGLVTVISAIFTFFLKSPINNSDVKVELHCILIIGLSLLFIFGVIVFARVIWSDRKIKKHQELWTISYEQIKKIEHSIQCYRDKLDIMDDYKFKYPFRAIKGTLPQIMMIIDSIIAFLLMYVISSMLNCSIICSLLISFPTSVLVFIMFWGWYQHLKSDLVKKESEKNPNVTDTDLKADNR